MCRRTVVIEQVSTVLAPHLYLKREVTHELNDLRHMVVVLGEQLSLALRVEQVLRSQELEDLP